MGSLLLGDGHRACAAFAKLRAWNREWGTWTEGRCGLPIPLCVVIRGWRAPAPALALWLLVLLIGWAM